MANQKMEAAEMTHSEVQSLLDSANDFAEDGQFEAAIWKFNQALQLTDWNWNQDEHSNQKIQKDANSFQKRRHLILESIAQCFLELGQFEQAIQYAEAAVTEEDWIDGYVTLTQACLLAFMKRLEIWSAWTELEADMIMQTQLQQIKCMEVPNWTNSENVDDSMELDLETTTKIYKDTEVEEANQYSKYETDENTQSQKSQQQIQAEETANRYRDQSLSAIGKAISLGAKVEDFYEELIQLNLDVAREMSQKIIQEIKVEKSNKNNDGKSKSTVDMDIDFEFDIKKDSEQVQDQQEYVKLCQENPASCGPGAHIWQSGIILSALLTGLAKVKYSNQMKCQKNNEWDKSETKRFNVLELGSGCGVAGIGFANALHLENCNTNANICCTDIEGDVLDNLKSNIQRFNQMAYPDKTITNLQTEEKVNTQTYINLTSNTLNWDKAKSDLEKIYTANFQGTNSNQIEIDLILGADLIYNEKQIPAFTNCLNQIAHRNNQNAHMILAHQSRRDTLDEKFVKEVRGNGFTVEELASLRLSTPSGQFTRNFKIFKIVI